MREPLLDLSASLTSELCFQSEQERSGADRRGKKRRREEDYRTGQDRAKKKKSKENNAREEHRRGEGTSVVLLHRETHRRGEGTSLVLLHRETHTQEAGAQKRIGHQRGTSPQRDAQKRRGHQPSTSPQRHTHTLKRQEAGRASLGHAGRGVQRSHRTTNSRRRRVLRHLNMSLSWLAVALLCGPLGPVPLGAMAPENEVPLRPTTWLLEDKVTPIHLPKGKTRRFYFTLKKKTPSMSLTVSPCGAPIEWTLAARTLKDKPPKNLHWSSKKSMPEVWWRGPGTEAKIHTYTGNSADTYTGPAYAPASIYILRLKSQEQDTSASVYLHEGHGSSGAFPKLPADPRVHTLGVGLTSVSLSWNPSSSVTQPSHSVKHLHDYCVLVNRNHNYRSLCAAREGIKKERERDWKREKKDKQRKETVWPILKDWWWQQWDTYGEIQPSTSAASDDFAELGCTCRGVESVCTVSELLPDTQYYFDVFVIDKLNGTSAAYTGTFARTHEEAQPAVIALKEGEPRLVSLQDGRGSSSSSGSGGGRQQGATVFSFRPRGWQQNGLLTLQSCNGTQKMKVVVTSRGKVLLTQEVGEQLAQIWLQGGPSYLIRLESSEASAVTGRPRVAVKIQASSAYHRQAAPVLPATLQMKSFNKLRSCNSITLAWMGTEERSLYCVYQRRLSDNDGKDGAGRGNADRCLGPETRPDSERVLCKYFQELNPRRAVTTAVIGGLEPGAAYLLDVYLMRRWGIPIKYHSKTVRTRREC